MTATIKSGGSKEQCGGGGGCRREFGGGITSLPATLQEGLRKRFVARRADYVARVLTRDEISVIGDLNDAVIIARIKRMPRRRLARFDQLVPIDDATLRLFQTLQLNWLRDEEYLLGTRLGRSPTVHELFTDFVSNENGQRFRAYFSLKYPGRMRPTRRAA